MSFKSFTFGLGFGIILLSIVFYAVNYFDDRRLIDYYSKQTEVVEISDEDVIQRAVGLGMLTQDDHNKAISDIEPIIENVVVEKELTDDQIIDKAYELGMVFPDVSFSNSNNNEPLEEQEAEAEQIEGYNQFTSVKIDGGLPAVSIAKLLQRNGVVDNADAFQRFLINRGVTTILNAGTFVFPINASYDDALDVLRRRKKF